MAVIRYGNDTVSGTGIRYNMNARTFSFGWNNFMEIEQQPGKALASGLDVRFPEHRYGGHSAPEAKLTGYIDTSVTPGTATGNTNVASGSVNIDINVGALGSLALAGSGYLYSPMVNTFIGKHPHDISDANQDIGGSVSVAIKTINLIPTLGFQKAGSEYLIDYNMTMTLVSGPV